ncbi:MAG: hypothetical protein ACREDL_22320, partial [Bradyrhizobium sp.]
MKIIGKRNQRLRLAIGDPENRRSNLWRIAAYKSDVYVTCGGAVPAKFSFHKSGICRDAFTSEFGPPAGMHDRVMTRWKRADIPLADTGKACSVLEVAFPTDFLSTGLEAPAKPIHWIDTATPGHSKCIEMFFSGDKPDVAEPLINQAQRTPIAAFPLENGSWFYVASHTIAFPGQEIRILATGNRKFDFLIRRHDVPSSDRSIRILALQLPLQEISESMGNHD